MPNAAWSEDEGGSSWAIGARNCGEYIELGKKVDGAGSRGIGEATALDYTHTLRWIAGYITSVNWQMPNTYDILGGGDFRSVLLWLENYCREYPSDNLALGMPSLAAELYAKRHKTKRKRAANSTLGGACETPVGSGVLAVR